MFNESLDSRFLFPNPLLPLGEFLLKFSEQSLFPVAVRSLENTHRIRDGKIIMHNRPSGILRGFKDGVSIGMTIPEVLSTSPIHIIEREKEIEAIEKNDQEAVTNNHQNVHTQVTLDHNGLVRVFQRIVTPLSGYNGKIIALSTTSLELTQYTQLLHLLELYKRHYCHHPEKGIKAVEKFSEYLKLEDYFTTRLTMGEMTALLAMATDARHKQAAELITSFYQKSRTSKTISNYTALIQQKMKPDIDFHKVLRGLRDYYQLQPALFHN